MGVVVKGVCVCVCVNGCVKVVCFCLCVCERDMCVIMSVKKCGCIR